MGLLGNLMVSLGINAAQFTAGLAGASSAANTFSRQLAASFQNTANASSLAGNAVNIFSQGTASGFKDIARIAQGIVVSQMFYRTVNSITSATSALGEFSMQCEDARMSFGVLMKDQDKANKFMYTIQDFAAKTPFTVQQSVDQARKLLAYGFNPSNMSPIMNTLADASAASGDAQSFERIGRALGQIRTKGKLASQELLQLTEAGIPAFEILRDKLHLTQAEMGKIGKLGISGDVAINAILKGMQERYAGAAAAMAETTRGMLSTIKDDMLIVGSEATSPIYESFKNTVRKMRNALDGMRNVVREGGIGYLMQQMIPASIFPKVQIFVANLINMKDNVALLIQALAPFGSAIMEFIINVLNLAIPIVNAFNRVLIMIVYIASQCTPFVRNLVGAIMGLLITGAVISLLANFIGVLRGLFVVRLIAQLIISLAQAIRILTLAMISNPWMALLGVATGALLYFGMTSKKVSGWIDGLGGGITKTFGKDPSKVFVPKMKENNEQAGQFNKNLGLSKDKLDNMGKAAKKSAKAAKDMLMSFDEVFNLKDQDENDANPDAGAANDLGDIGDIGSPEIPAIEAPEMPETDGLVQNWVDDFKNKLILKLKNALIGAAIGAVVGGIFGGLLGGPDGAIMGAKIGALAGAIAGYFWDQMPENIHSAFKGAGIGAAIGGILGGLMGGPTGAAIGMGVGALLGAITGYFWDQFPDSIKNAFKGAGIGAAIGGCIGMLFGGPGGAVIGAGIGALIGSIAGYFWDQIPDGIRNAVGNKTTLIGAGIGALLGAMFGGPAGALIGAGIGTLVMSIVNYFWDGMTTQIQDATKGAGIGAAIGIMLGMIIGGPAGALIVGAIGTLVGAIVGYFFDGISASLAGSTSRFLTDIQTWWGQVANQFALAFSGSTDQTWLDIGGHIIAGILAGLAAAVLTIADAVYQYVFVPIYEGIKSIFGIHSPATTMYPIGGYLIAGIWEGIKQGMADFLASIVSLGGQVYQSFSTWLESCKTGVKNWVTDTKTSFSTWWTDTKTGFDTWCSNVGTSFSTWWSDTKTGFSTWSSNVITTVSTWSTDAYNNIVTWASKASTEFSTWCNNTKTGFETWSTNTKTSVINWASETGTKISTWSTESYKFINDWITNTKTGFSTWYTDTKTSIETWSTTAGSTISTWATNSYTSISTWWTNTASGFKTWAKSCFDGVSGWFDNITTSIGKAIDSLDDFNKTKSETSYSSDSDDGGDKLSGHARGGIFNKEHIAHFAEGNKAEAIIPLENAGAMQPFVDAVAGGLSASVGNMLASITANNNQSASPSDSRQILYVGTLIADDSSLKELDRKMRIVTVQENQRRGL